MKWYDVGGYINIQGRKHPDYKSAHVHANSFDDAAKKFTDKHPGIEVSSVCFEGEVIE